MATRDRARKAAAAVARLPAEPRAVLSLFAIEGLSHREIADILGVPEGTVWSRLHAARRALLEVVDG
jgi:RNA polymerase sigma-70 factor (ECF subfamily)